MLAKGDGALQQDPLAIAGRNFSSRLIVGTGKFGSFEVMRDAIDASGTEMVTVALRRGGLRAAGGPHHLQVIHAQRWPFLPNTARAGDAAGGGRNPRFAPGA